MSDGTWQLVGRDTAAEARDNALVRVAQAAHQVRLAAARGTLDGTLTTLFESLDRLYITDDALRPPKPCSCRGLAHRDGCPQWRLPL